MAKKAVSKKGNPARRAEELRISQVGDFKKRIGGIMELPSGAVVKMKNPGGLQAFLGEGGGDIPNSLMVIIQKSLKKGKPPAAKDLMNSDGSVDPEMVEAMTTMMENVLAKTVVEPPVQPTPTQATVDKWNAENPDDVYDSVEEYQAREDLLFANEFPDVDKQFVFGWVTGGVKDLETFRQQQLEMLGSLEPSAGAKKATK